MAEPQNLRPLTIRELAEATGLSISTLRRRVRDGSLRAIQLGGKHKILRFSPQMVEELLALGTASPDPNSHAAANPAKPTVAAVARSASDRPVPPADPIVLPDSGPVPNWMRSPLISKPNTPGNIPHD